ncbi:MAG TPA: hypothetical protein VG244_12310 [Acidimicrobiales bacterium]|nr:hypothetical protein [Acidimicrobiales bacterium]
MTRWRVRIVAGLVLAVPSGVTAIVGAGAPSAASSVAGASTGADQSRTVWLCRPGKSEDPCTAPLTATAVAACGARVTQHAQDDPASKFDCFYVYPTVSTEKSANADLTVQRAEVDAAVEPR